MEYFDVLNSRGDFTNEIASRKECHEKGLWHKAIVVQIISTDNKRVLLQKRSANKRMWPNLWDVASGGHVLAGELGYQAGIREAKEELGVDLKRDELEFIGATTSENIQKDIINRHYNEYYIVHKDIDLNDITIQEDEVQEVKWFNVEELKKRVNNNFEELTDKVELWHYLIKYFDFFLK